MCLNPLTEAGDERQTRNITLELLKNRNGSLAHIPLQLQLQKAVFTESTPI